MCSSDLKRFADFGIDLRFGPALKLDGSLYVGSDRSLVTGLYSTDKSRATSVGGRIMTLDDALNVQAEAERELNIARETDGLASARRFLRYV